MDPFTLLIGGFIWLVLMILVIVAARNRGRSGIVYFLISLLLSPLVGLLLVLILGQSNRSSASGAMRECPNCAETIKAKAFECRYCGEPLDPDEYVPPRTILGVAGKVVGYAVFAFVAIGTLGYVAKHFLALEG